MKQRLTSFGYMLQTLVSSQRRSRPASAPTLRAILPCPTLARLRRGPCADPCKADVEKCSSPSCISLDPSSAPGDGGTSGRWAAGNGFLHKDNGRALRFLDTQRIGREYTTRKGYLRSFDDSKRTRNNLFSHLEESCIPRANYQIGDPIKLIRYLKSVQTTLRSISRIPFI